jgi:Rrf2 family protein
MLKLTKKADYGLIALRHLSVQRDGATISASAKDIADSYRVPLPLLSKVLQKLVRNGMLVSEQGVHGGYRLARPASEINTLEVIRAIDGPIILTQCFTEHAEPIECQQTALCPVREPLRKVHEGILRLLSSITIADLCNDEWTLPDLSGIRSIVSSIQPSRQAIRVGPKSQ